MEKDQQIQYSLKAYLATEQKGVPRKEYDFSIFWKLKYTENKVLHHKKTNFPLKVLEFEFVKIDFSTNDKTLGKSIDFLHRTFYRYDGLKLSITPNGMTIENKELLLNQWQQIRSSLQADYKGFFAEDYLALLDDRMSHCPPTDNYFYLGLLFLEVSESLGVKQSRNRQIMQSDFDDICFTERLTCEHKGSGQVYFSITGEFTNQHDCLLNKFYGRTQIREECILPEWVQLEVDYVKEDINIYWKYELTRQEENSL